MADEPLYEVALFGDVAAKVSRWRDVTRRLNRVLWFIRAMNHIDEQLHSCPVTWGDPMFD